jgi:hypothetical protein
MKSIESKISPLLVSQFPSFYQEEGPNFIAFIIAYYEWLEQNFQLLDLESVENFKIGDTVQQENVTGKIFSILGNSILVLVDGLETFKCFNICSELLPVTSSSGGSTYILRGGTTRRLGSLFMSRNLFNIRDIDKTIDLFIVRFKEKYLKNIEFDTETNKRLLVKNSLDLYRSKGTSRSIDLFFRLIYGVKSSVYYPGDDLFRLSDAEWFKPQYIEINSTSVDRAIQLVGKQITGVNSGATAFVERYIKKKVKSGVVHVFYVSNVRGEFQVNERLKYVQIFPDSPRIIGSFNAAAVVDGSEDFEVGDVVNFSSAAGLGAIGLVTDTVKGTGEVSFTLANSGWGYTTNRVGSTYSYSSNTFLSDKILLVANVESGQYVSNINPITSGSGYNNTDLIYVFSRYDDAVIRPVTNSSGSILSSIVTERGTGYYPQLETPPVSIINSTSYPSQGVGATFNIQYEYPKKYFEYLETITQPLFFITYQNPVGLDFMSAGSLVDINNIDKLGRLIEIDTVNNTMLISLLKNDIINSGDVVHLDANTTNKVDVVTVSLREAKAQVINVSNTAIMEIGTPSGQFTVGDVLYQRNSANDIAATATITSTSNLTLGGGIINVKDLQGVFRNNEEILVEGKTSSALFKNITLNVAIVGSSNTLVDSFSPVIYSSNNGTRGFVDSTTSGSNAQYRIASLTNTQDVKVNTDRLCNNTILDMKLNALAYGLQGNTFANSSSIIFSALMFQGITVGSVATLGDINPGTGYNRDPITSLFQNYITGYQARDYIFTIKDNETQFIVGEFVEQTSNSNFVKVFVSNTDPYLYGEKVHAANTTTSFIANGIVFYINSANKYIDLEFPAGTFPTSNSYTLKSLFSTANSFITNAVPFVGQFTSRGVVKDSENDLVYVKRVQLENRFITGKTITGSLSGTSANLVSVDLDPNSDPAGLNAKVRTKATTANGVINTVQIIDSGYGFSNDDDITFVANTDSTRFGTVSNIRGGVGIGTGYYRTAKGFLSDISRIHDGDYYQEYSYDIISRIPLEKYSAMFKKVMHTAGTRFFGSVLIDTIANTTINVANSLITIDDSSPYVIQDRRSIDVEDRGDFFIEIRE